MSERIQLGIQQKMDDRGDFDVHVYRGSTFNSGWLGSKLTVKQVVDGVAVRLEVGVEHEARQAQQQSRAAL